MNKIKAWIIKKLGGYTEIPTAQIVNEMPFVLHCAEKPLITLQGTFEIPDNAKVNEEEKNEIIKRNICKSIANEIYKAGAYEQKKMHDECLQRDFYKIIVRVQEWGDDLWKD